MTNPRLKQSIEASASGLNTIPRIQVLYSPGRSDEPSAIAPHNFFDPGQPKVLRRTIRSDMLRCNISRLPTNLIGETPCTTSILMP